MSRKYEVIVTSYEVISIERAALRKFKWEYVVLLFQCSFGCAPVSNALLSRPATLQLMKPIESRTSKAHSPRSCAFFTLTIACSSRARLFR